MPSCRFVLGMYAALAGLWVAQASAAPIAYVLTPDVPGFVVDGNSYDVSATFDFDTATELESDVNIVLTGSGSYAGTYTSANGFASIVHVLVPANDDACGIMGLDSVCLRFTHAIGTVVPDPLYLIASSDAGIAFDYETTGVDFPTNGAAAVLATTVIPEPSSLSLLAIGMFGGLLTLRRHRLIGAGVQRRLVWGDLEGS